MPHFDVELHHVAPQIDVAILQPCFFVGQRRIAGQKRRLLGLVEKTDLLCHQLYFARGNVFVDGVWIALLHPAGHRDHVLVAQA